jgi:hypothetical protein
MNRLDATQIEIPTVNLGTAKRMVLGTYVVVVLAAATAVFAGVSGTNPVDRFFAGVAELPLSMLFVDVWALVVVFTRRHAKTPLRVPIKTPLILATIHLAFGLAARHFVHFDVLYGLAWVNDRVGNYEVQPAIAAALVGFALLSLLLAGFEARLVRWVLLSEITSAVSPDSAPPVAEAEDLELGPEHAYEAQVLLNNLGYDVSPITGELNPATVDSLIEFQKSVVLEPDGKLTAKSMIELRNLWRTQEEEASPAMAVSEHAFRKTGSRIARFFRRS